MKPNKKKEFVGFLQKIKPRDVLQPDLDLPIENLFLVLALIYNDFKGVLLFNHLFKETYEQPTNTREANPHMGEYYAVNTQIFRMLIGIINEFFTTLNKNKKILTSTEFLLLEKKMPKKALMEWRKLKSIAINPRDPKNSRLLSKIAQIRSNVLFHYDQSFKVMRKSFISRFFEEEEKNIGNEHAYISLGGKIESSRFYYCDAAIEKYVNENFGLNSGDEDIKELKKVSENLSKVIIELEITYFKLKGINI